MIATKYVIHIIFEVECMYVRAVRNESDYKVDLLYHRQHLGSFDVVPPSTSMCLTTEYKGL